VIKEQKRALDVAIKGVRKLEFSHMRMPFIC